MKVFRLVLALSLVILFRLTLFSETWAAAPKEIQVGVALPLTGPLAMDGTEMKWAYEQTVADINKAGGVFVKKYGKRLQVKLIVVDDEGVPPKASDAIERLIKLDKVDFMFSTMGAPNVIAGMVVADKFKKYYHGTTIFPFLYVERKFKFATNYFFDAAGAAEVPFLIWKSLPESERPKRPALLMEDSLDGQGFAQGFRAFAQKYGYTFAVDEPWAMGAKDYSTQLLKAKAKNVDAVLVYASPTDTITLVRQMKETGLNVKYFHGWKGTWTNEFYEALGQDADYIVCDGFWSEDFPYPGAKELGERYHKQFGKHSVTVGLFYACGQTLWKAIETAGVLDSAKVREAVLGTSFKGTVMGDVKYDPASGQALSTSTANQWAKGKQELVYPAVKGATQVKMMPDWDKR